MGQLQYNPLARVSFVHFLCFIFTFDVVILIFESVLMGVIVLSV